MLTSVIIITVASLTKSAETGAVHIKQTISRQPANSMDDEMKAASIKIILCFYFDYTMHVAQIRL